MDYYDSAVKYLQSHPSEIEIAWMCPGYHICGRLFEFVGHDGCLTMIRNHTAVAPTEQLTVEIRSDERIPRLLKEITPESLPVFAGWQRQLDERLGRKSPVWNGPVMP